ncbi:MAG TPA: chemotaxis protein CheA [Opitutaceae bacterium]
MNEDHAPMLGQELLDDFFAECDEHFRTIREKLSAQAMGPEALEALSRALHTVKGNAGIVGLPTLEQLAHATEELLRQHARGNHPISKEAIQLIADAIARMEQVVAAFRTRRPLPDTTDLIAHLAEGPVDLDAGPSRWRARFAPSAERDGRGVNINSIRTRLAAAGEITAAEPAVLPGGGFQFLFTVNLPHPPGDLAVWTHDGVTWEPMAAVPSETPAGSSPAPATTAAPSHLVRVDLSRLDELMRLVGEMVIQRSRLTDRISRIGDSAESLQEPMAGLGRLIRDLRAAITRMRLVPIAEIFNRLPFVVRDLEKDSDKRVRLALEGETTEIDKYLVERLREPLLHLVRNAVSHGIEMPDERRRQGKPPEAQITLRASARGDFVLLEISDDGRGIDAAAVTRRAAEAGLALPANPDANQLLQVLCAPGFSTRDEADRAAGRGVGLDVVASVVRELGGSLSLETHPGQGCKFTLRLPLTLSIAETFIVSAGPHLCAVPQGFVEEILQIPMANLRQVQGVAVAPYRDGLLPVTSLHEMFGSPRSDREASPLVVIGSDRGLTGLLVDRVHGHREVVIRPLNDPLVRVRGIAGATELGDGKPVLILDPTALASGPVRPRATPVSA